MKKHSAGACPRIARRAGSFLNGFSIRSRIFCYFLLFALLLLLLLWLFQTVMLDEFYRYQKTVMLKSSAESIARNIGNEELYSLATRIGQENEVCILLTDAYSNPVLSVDVSAGCVIHHISSYNLRKLAEEIKSQEGLRLRVFELVNFRNQRYEADRFAGRVPPKDTGDVKSMLAMQRITFVNGTEGYLYLNAVITPVTATVQTLRSQLWVVSAVMVLLSFFLSLVLSKRITQPIVATTVAAKELAVGRFTPVETSVNYLEVEALNKQLTQAALDLQKVEGLQRELIANISHDLRTPLTLIEGYAEVMRDLPGESTPENMQVIIDETKRLSTLVNAILEYSAHKNGGSQPKVAYFDLTESILGILQRYQKLTEQDGYQIQFEYEKHCWVWADEVKVGQVVYNLINNALTYTGEDKRVTVTQKQEKAEVRLEVRDSGEGISSEDMPYIWSRYYRGNKPHKRAAIGTGLGLSIVQGILEEHHLRYGVESEKGKGTCFWFCLPVEGQPGIIGDA